MWANTAYIVPAREMVTRPPWLRPRTRWPPRTGPCWEAPWETERGRVCFDSCCCLSLAFGCGVAGLLQLAMQRLVYVHVYIYRGCLRLEQTWQELLSPFHSSIAAIYIFFNWYRVHDRITHVTLAESLSFNPYIIIIRSIRSSHLSKFMIFLPLMFICLSYLVTDL